MISEAHFQFSSKYLKRQWEYFKYYGNSGGLFKVFPIYSVFSSDIFTFFQCFYLLISSAC